MVDKKRSRTWLAKLTLIGLTIILLGDAAQATTAVMLSDEDLIVSSRAIVRGKVSSIESQFDDSHSRIYTYITIDLKSILKGSINSRQIVIRQLGGRVGDFMQLIYGAPEYKVGENVLLYLNTADDGALRVAHIFMGKFSIVKESRTGKQIVQRLVKDVKTLEQESTDTEITNQMELSAYQEKIHTILSERADRVAQFERKNAGRPMLAVPAEFSARRSSSSIQPQYSFMGSGFRWFEPDTGTPVIYRLNPANAPVPNDVETEFKSALAAWTGIAKASINLQSGSPTSSCGFVADGITSVSFSDCRNEIEDPVNCQGVLAIGGISGATGETKVINGKSFFRIVEGDVVFNNNFECFLGESSNLAEVMTHEIGHSIGLGHSSEVLRESNTDLKDATMFFAAHGDGRGASVRTDDMQGATFIYPFILPPVSISNFSPMSGIVGNSITIYGNGLKNPTSVKFGNVSTRVYSSSNSEVVVFVPATGVTGKISVTTTEGTAQSTEIFTIIKPPSTGTFLPASGAAGTMVTINGSNFAGALDVKFNNVSASFTVVSNTSIRAAVPEGATTGKISVGNAAGTSIGIADFKVLPKITALSATSGTAGSSMTINGFNLSNPKSVKIGTGEATILSSSHTQIVVTVPSTATTGRVTVTTASGTATSTNLFTMIKPPSIGSFTPSGRVGSIITISGTNLSGVTSIEFNGTTVTGPVTLVSSTYMKVTVPQGATTGKIRITNQAGTAESTKDFIVIQ